MQKNKEKVQKITNFALFSLKKQEFNNFGTVMS